MVMQTEGFSSSFWLGVWVSDVRFLLVSGPGQQVVAPGAGHTLDTDAGPRMLNIYPTLKIWSKPRVLKD